MSFMNDYPGGRPSPETALALCAGLLLGMFFLRIILDLSGG